MQVVPGRAGGRSFKIETRHAQTVPFWGAGKPSVHRSNNLLTFHSAAISFLISSDLIASQLLLEIVHCIPLSS